VASLSPEVIEVWRGSVPAWECDSMGHLNVGFYLAKVMEALVGFAAELGMPRAFTADAQTTLIVREHHMRFLREAATGARLHINAGVLELGESEARLQFLMCHHDNQFAATFQMLVRHAAVGDGQDRPWPDEVRARAERYRMQTPEKAAPRSVPLGPVQTSGSLTRALQLGLRRIGMGAFRPNDCDAFGRMRAEAVMVRISDATAHLMAGLLEELAARDGRAPGGVVVEYRLIYLDWPRTGERWELRSGLTGEDPRLRRMIHWFLNPATGKAWAAAEGVLAIFDPQARKMVTLDEAGLAKVLAANVPDLSI
jgi:acyl-CoA thioester hydrolase